MRIITKIILLTIMILIKLMTPIILFNNYNDNDITNVFICVCECESVIIKSSALLLLVSLLQ